VDGYKQLESSCIVRTKIRYLGVTSSPLFFSVERKFMMKSFSEESVVSKIILEYVQQPDYSEIRDKVEEYTADGHGFVVLKQRLTQNANGLFSTRWSKILFTTADSVIVQHLEMTVACTRFTVTQILYQDWENWFVKHIPNTDGCFFVCLDCWTDGCRMYGAQV